MLIESDSKQLCKQTTVPSGFAVQRAQVKRIRCFWQRIHSESIAWSNGLIHQRTLLLAGSFFDLLRPSSLFSFENMKDLAFLCRARAKEKRKNRKFRCEWRPIWPGAPPSVRRIQQAGNVLRTERGGYGASMALPARRGHSLEPPRTRCRARSARTRTPPPPPRTRRRWPPRLPHGRRRPQPSQPAGQKTASKIDPMT